jgi:hypothetical protein
MPHAFVVEHRPDIPVFARFHTVLSAMPREFFVKTRLGVGAMHKNSVLCALGWGKDSPVNRGFWML